MDDDLIMLIKWQTGPIPGQKVPLSAPVRRQAGTGREDKKENYNVGEKMKGR